MIISFLNEQEVIIPSFPPTTLSYEERLSSLLVQRSEKEKQKHLSIKPIGTFLLSFLQRDFKIEDDFNAFAEEYGIMVLPSLISEHHLHYFESLSSINKIFEPETYRKIMHESFIHFNSSLSEIQGLFKKTFNACLDSGNLETAINQDKSPAKRYFIFKKLSGQNSYANTMDTYSKNIKLFKSSLPKELEILILLFGTNASSVLPSEKKLELISNIEFQHVDVYESNSIASLCYISFMEMMRHNIYTRKCKNCDTYFVVKGRKDTEYCDRIAPGHSGKLCREIGPTNEFRKRAEENPLQLAYLKLYKSKHSKMSKIKDKEEQEKERNKLKKWVKSAKAKIKANEMSYDEFMDWGRK